jgi:cytochrome c oxidase assembly protein subunit 15
MNGHVVPPEIFMLEPWYMNFFNNMATVQFVHRAIAWMLAFVVPYFWFRTRRVEASPRVRLAGNWLLLALAGQIALGITTLLYVVPVPLAAAHQAGAMVVFGIMLWVNHELRVPAGWQVA